MSSLIKKINHTLERTWPYSPYQFSLWRIGLGVYLFVYAVLLLPYVVTLYSSAGIFSGPLLPFLFPNILYLNASPTVVYTLAILQILFAIGIALGYRRRLSAILYLYIAAVFLQWNPLTEDPSLAFTHFSLALLLLIPTGEPLSLSRAKSKWYMSYFVYTSSLVIIGVGFSMSGLDKLQALGWRNGDALYYLFQYPITYDVWWLSWLTTQPLWLSQLETWFTLAVMLLALPMLLWRKTRFLSWFLITLFFVGTLFVFDLVQVSIGVLLYMVFIFDRRWIPGSDESLTMYYDESCAFCRGWVAFVQAEDFSQKITPIPIQHSEYSTTNHCYESIIVVSTDGQVRKYSVAVVALLHSLGGMWRFFALLLSAVPLSWRDRGYLWVAKNRFIFNTRTKK